MASANSTQSSRAKDAVQVGRPEAKDRDKDRLMTETSVSSFRMAKKLLKLDTARSFLVP